MKTQYYTASSLDGYIATQDDSLEWLFSLRTLSPVPGAEIHFVRGDVRAVHATMATAAGGKNVWIVSGGELVGQFYDHGLLDEIFVQVGSVTLGGGKPAVTSDDRQSTPTTHVCASRRNAVCGVALRGARKAVRILLTDRVRTIP